jgi:predicted lipid-binding transport protein (Tim44 family)
MTEYQPTPPPDNPPERAGLSEEQENEEQGSPGCGLMGCMGGTLFGGILMIVLSVADAFVVSGGGNTYTNIVTFSPSASSAVCC